MNLVLRQMNPLVSLIFGVLILLFPRLLTTLIGIYLILIGLIGLGLLRV